MSASLIPEPVPMTIPEFLEAARHHRGRCHLIDGELIAMAPASRLHGRIQAAAVATLVNHLRDSGSSCQALGAPGVVPAASASINMRVPDLAVVCPDAGADDPFGGPPRVVVEVLSPSYASVTWANVWAHTTIPEVHDILVLALRVQRADVLCRRPDGTWPANAERVEAGGTVALPGIGFVGPLAAFYPIDVR